MLFTKFRFTGVRCICIFCIVVLARVVVKVKDQAGLPERKEDNNLEKKQHCLQLQVYRDEKERARNGHTKASLSMEDFLAMETGFTLDKESHTLAIICQDLCVVLAFDNRERLIQWSVRIANNLGEGQHFLVQLASVPAKSKLTPGPAKLHVTDKRFCLTGGIPPRLLGHWEIPHLRRYGIVDGRIVFEGGSRCGKNEGVHVMISDPPQMKLIIDALDMSSKGQLGKGPSTRRFGNVTDSPRKSMSSRLSEMRTLSSMPCHESSANISVINMNQPAPSSSSSSSSTIPCAPRESWSAEALCSACSSAGEMNHQQANHQSQIWSDSRCELLDNCDSISMCPAAGGVDESSHHHHPNNYPPSSSSARTVTVGPHSPARNPAGTALQIAKPLPSAMERCLSCMSKLGQQTDILSPSWTMDLNVSAASASMGGGGGGTANLPSSSTGLQGSIGSGNSDRLSISSHGSGSGVGVGGGGPAEYYYDTPRSVLVAEMRRNARSNTPPGMFQNGSSNQMSNPCHNGGQTQQGGITSTAVCASPCRGPRNHNISIAPQPQPCPNQSYNGAAVCVLGNCHCQQQPSVMGGQQQSGGGGGHIYYNGVAEQKSLGGNKTHPPQPINLHMAGATTGGPGPYENYDFPRCVPPPAQNPGLGCYPYSEGASTSGIGLNGTSSMSSIDWNKKLPMDRSSIATTASTSISLVGSSSDQEFYDTPKHCPCCTQNPTSGCPCCSQHPPPNNNNNQHLQHHHHQHSVQQYPPVQHQHHTQNPSCILRRGNGLENYDIPPHNNPHNVALTSPNMQHSITSTSISINGEGKMPLVAGSIPTRPTNNPNAIYAQVDKSKKTPRPGPPNQQQFVVANCDNLPIYENRNSVQHQPTYTNMVEGSGGVGGCGQHHNIKTMKPPAPDPSTTDSSLPMEFGHSNYVNLQFAESLQLYENAKEISSSDFSHTATKYTTKETTVLVHPEPKIETILENEYENSAAAIDGGADAKKSCDTKITSSVVVPPKDATCTTAAPTASGTTAITSGSESKEPSSATDSGMEIKDKGNSSTTSPPSSTSTSAEESRRGSQESDEAISLPLRRSSSVPCKGGHANRGSASSSDSGVSGDGGLFFDDSSPLNDIGSRYHQSLHESLPRKSQRTSPGGSNGKNTSATSTPRPQEVEISTPINPSSPTSPNTDLALANRHYETIEEAESNSTGGQVIKTGGEVQVGNNVVLAKPIPVNPLVAAVKCGEMVQSRRNLVSGANSTSSGNSDCTDSDYIETLSTLSSCSRGSGDTVATLINPHNVLMTTHHSDAVNLNISASPKKSTSMKPRSGKEYFKIDRSLFKKN
ncbi:Protein Dok-7 [Folsomia candida]|uniref:Protein Dok-7 n=1 Tax=Folsomia candida TaxID=158441 RepID=A0A226E2T6_FOLCA|nr:Protein Dok-7 [Folsomia candida]